jgi:hypothetical protein
VVPRASRPVKGRPDQNGRAATCVEVQRFAAAQGLPAAAPLTGVTVDSGVAIHAEEWRPGGHLRRGDDAATARLLARLLAALVTLAADVEVGGDAPGAVQPPLPNSEWMRWDDDLRSSAGRRVRGRLAVVDLPRVLGHGDWETQNLRWNGDEPYAVHDWDSLCWLPEAAIAGAASGAFASAETPSLGADRVVRSLSRRLSGRPAALRRQRDRGLLGREPVAGPV